MNQLNKTTRVMSTRFSHVSPKNDMKKTTFHRKKKTVNNNKVIISNYWRSKYIKR